MPPPLVGQPHDRYLGYLGMSGQFLLNLYRIHVLAAGVDHVVDPAGYPQVAVLVKVARVAGEVPPAAQRLRRRVRAVVVAAKGVVAEADDDLAALAVGNGIFRSDRRLGIGLDEPELGVERCTARAARLPARLGVGGEDIDLRAAVVVYEHLGVELLYALLNQ